jgi:hypothetical protein
MHYKLKQKAIHLRNQKHYSYNAILAQIPVAKSTLHEWLKDFPLSKERIEELRKISWKKRETQVELRRESIRIKRENENQILYEKYLEKFNKVSKSSEYIAGLILYLAEGTKNSCGKLTVTNTDPKIIVFFINWIQKFYSYPKEKIKIFLQLYPNMDIEKELSFWENTLELSRSQFYKPFIRELRPSSFSYHESHRHGTCAAIAFGAKNQRDVTMAYKALLDCLNFKRV